MIERIECELWFRRFLLISNPPSSILQPVLAELSEPELLIIFKDDLDMGSYPPWHIRLTEIL